MHHTVTSCNYKEIPDLSLKERCLVSLSLGRQLTAEDMKILMDRLDIDRCSQTELLLLSCIGYQQGWELFPADIIPRLKGLHRYYQVHNTIRFSWLAERIHILRTAGIPVMLLKGLAFRAYYEVHVPRIMGDYDIAVPEERYDDAIRLLQNVGDIYMGRTSLHHGVIVRKGRDMEIHCWIFKHHGEKGTDIWERAVPCSFFGEDVCVLCPEDMLLHQLDNRARDMFSATFPDRTAIFLRDCHQIIDRISGPDMAGLAARAKEFHVTYSVRRMLLLLADCFPELFFREEIDREFPKTAEYQRWLKAGLRQQRAFERWTSYRYRPEGSLTPLRIMRTLPHHFACYHMRKIEAEEMGCGYGFWQYCRDTGRSESFLELMKKYGVRLRLTADRQEG